MIYYSMLHFTRECALVSTLDDTIRLIERETGNELVIRRGNDMVGNPQRSQMSQFERFELFICLEWKNSLSSNSSQQYLNQQYPPPLLGELQGPHEQEVQGPELPGPLRQLRGERLRGHCPVERGSCNRIVLPFFGVTLWTKPNHILKNWVLVADL